LSAEIVATGILLAGSTSAILFRMAKWHREGKREREAQEQKHREEEQKKYVELKASVDRLCETREDDRKLAEQRRQEDEQRRQEDEQRRQEERRADEQRRQEERRADEQRRQEDMSRLSGEIKDIGKKVDDMGERITHLGERVTRLEGQFEASGMISPRRAQPPDAATGAHGDGGLSAARRGSREAAGRGAGSRPAARGRRTDP